MIVFKLIKDISRKLAQVKAEGKQVGFVPTMGALHEGHLSLIKESRQQNDVTVCSIFVNPTQFNDINDFQKYPVTIENDIFLLEEHGNEILFLPAVAEMYPAGTQATEHYELANLEQVLEGKYRPGHFQGVCQVVHRLFAIVQPHKAYFGQKDFQQCMVIKKLVGLKNLPVEIIVHPTIRESNGLALSSRNARLSEADKEKATIIFKALRFIKENKNSLSIGLLQKEATDMILQNGFEKIDYFEIVEAETLMPVQDIGNAKKAVAIIAAFIGGVRLIDNMIL